MMRSILVSLVVVSALASPAFATAISADGSFHEFQLGQAVSAVVGCSDPGAFCTATTNPVAEVASSPPWTFSGAASVFVTDLGLRGDRFEVFDSGVSRGLTSVPINDGAGGCGFNIGDCSVAAGYSRGTFALGAGAHSLTINVVQNAIGTSSGSAVFSLSAAAVPEPGTLMLLGGGLGSLALARKRRR